MQQVKQSTATRHFAFLMVDSADHVTGKTGLSPTVTISKNCGSFAAPSGAVTEISAGWYKLAANATDSNTIGLLALHATATGADPTDALIANVVAYDPDDTVGLGLTALLSIPTATQNADALLNRDMGAVSDTNSRSPLNALRHIRNKWDTTTNPGYVTVHKENDSTEAWRAALSTDAAAEPITGSDPT